MKAGRSNIKAKVGRKKDYEKKGGQKIRRNLGGKEKKVEKKKKKSSAGFKLVRSICWSSCEMGGGEWRDWFHFSPFLSHTLCCCSACSPVPQGPSAPH